MHLAQPMVNLVHNSVEGIYGVECESLIQSKYVYQSGTKEWPSILIIVILERKVKRWHEM
jgi:hypothetical protein